MKVTVHFVDGEMLDGDAEQVSLDRGGFSLVGTAGNTRAAWVGAGAIKYIVIHAAFDETYGDTDPRAGTDLTKVVLHFLDGEIQHSYRDTVYAEQPGGFVLRLFDKQTHQLLKALVPGSSLKGVFVVDEWDSRTDSEKRSRRGPRRRPAERVAKAVPEPPAAGLPPVPVPEAEPGPVSPPAMVAHLAAEPVASEVGLPAAVVAALPETVADTLPAAAGEALPEMVAAAPPGAAETLPEAVAEAPPDAVVEAPPDAVPEPGPETAHARLEEPAVTSAAVVLASHYDPEERRSGFVGGLTKRRQPSEALTPAQERHLALRLRISEVLGALGPERPDDEA